MTTAVVTYDTGGRAQPVGALYVLPDRAITDAGATTALVDSGVDAAFVADLLSACLAHERCGVHLYRSVAGRTTDPTLRAQYEHFGEETVLILQGRCEDGGRVLGPGDRVWMPAGSSHSFTVLPGPDLLYLAVVHGGLRVGQLVLDASDPRV